MASGLGGLLPGIIGGAAEGAVKASNDIADAALKERAAARRAAAAERAAKKREDRADARVKLKGKSGSGKEDRPYSFKQEDYMDEESGENLKRWIMIDNKTGVRELSQNADDIRKYGPGIAKGLESGKTAAEIVESANNKGYKIDESLIRFIQHKDGIQAKSRPASSNAPKLKESKPSEVTPLSNTSTSDGSKPTPKRKFTQAPKGRGAAVKKAELAKLQRKRTQMAKSGKDVLSSSQLIREFNKLYDSDPEAALALLDASESQGLLAQATR